MNTPKPSPEIQSDMDLHTAWMRNQLMYIEQQAATVGGITRELRDVYHHILTALAKVEQCPVEMQGN